MSLREKARVRCLVTMSVYPLPRPKKTTFGDLKKIWVEEIHQIYRILTVCFNRCVRFTIHKQKSDILIYIYPCSESSFRILPTWLGHMHAVEFRLRRRAVICRVATINATLAYFRAVKNSAIYNVLAYNLPTP